MNNLKENILNIVTEKWSDKARLASALARRGKGKKYGIRGVPGRQKQDKVMAKKILRNWEKNMPNDNLINKFNNLRQNMRDSKATGDKEGYRKAKKEIEIIRRSSKKTISKT